MAEEKNSRNFRSYLFPAKAPDFRIGEYWSTHGHTHAPAGDGGQLFAYDMGVVA